MNLKRVHLAHGETVYVVAPGNEFRGLFDNYAIFDHDRPRHIASEMTVYKFRLDHTMERPGEFVGMSPQNHPVSLQQFPFRLVLSRNLVTMNERERNRICGFVTVESVAGQTLQPQLSEDWNEFSICYDSELAGAMFRYSGWRKFQIAEGYYAYVGR